MQTVTSADGTEMAYETRGEGPPLVLLHGDLTRRFWDPVVPRFTDDYTILAPDRRGRGDSGDHEENSLDREVADTLAVIDAAREAASADRDPVLFGHSLGGLQAIEAARRESVAAVLAYEPAVIVGEYREQSDLADRIEARLDEGDRRGAAKCHLREVVHGGEIEDAAFERWLDEWPHWPDYARYAENILRMDRAVESYDLPGTLDVDAPALILTGTEGPSHLRDSVRAVHDALPDSRLVEFDGVSHAGPVEAPDRVVGELREFLADVRVGEVER